VAPRERGGSRCVLLRRRGTALSCGCLWRCLPRSSGHSGGGLLVFVEVPSPSAWELLGSFSSVAYGGWLRRPVRTQGCRAPLPLLLPSCLLRRRWWCGGCGRRPCWNLEMKLLDRIAFCSRSRVLSVLLLGFLVILFFGGPLCNCVTDRCGNEAASRAFETPSPFKKKVLLGDQLYQWNQCKRVMDELKHIQPLKHQVHLMNHRTESWIVGTIAELLVISAIIHF
jgi:hypothetical protein